MAKTEVILTHTVVGLGAESDQVKVAAGFARNYLFPQGLAIPLTAANQKRIDSLRKRRVQREAHELSSMTELAQALSKLTLVIHVKTGEDGKLFGSVTAGVIADELKNQFDAALDKRKIHLLHPIKNVGDHEIELRLHPEVTTTLKVRVEGATPVAKPAEAAPAPAAKEGTAAKGGPAKHGPDAKAGKPEPKQGQAKPGKEGKAQPKKEKGEGKSAGGKSEKGA